MSCLCWEEILEVLLENFKEDEAQALADEEKMQIIKQREHLRRQRKYLKLKADPVAYRKHRDAENERRRKVRERKNNETTANV